MKIIKIANKNNKYYVDGLIAGCFSDYKEKMKEYNLKITKVSGKAHGRVPTRLARVFERQL